MKNKGFTTTKSMFQNIRKKEHKTRRWKFLTQQNNLLTANMNLQYNLQLMYKIIFYIYNKPSPNEFISIGGNSISASPNVSKP